MAATTLPDYPRGITFEQVWAAIMEDRENIRKRQKENTREFRKLREADRKFRESLEKSDREFRESMEETDRKFRESMEESDRKFRKSLEETDRIIGKLGNRFGELVEHLIAPNITEKFRDLRFNFEHISQNHVIRNAGGRCIAEIDLLLENGDTVMAVEVKSKPNQNDVDDHIGRMEVLRQRADLRNDTRAFQGAIAGAIMSEAVRDYAHKTGFYVIEQTGDTVKITIPENFKPREW